MLRLAALLSALGIASCGASSSPQSSAPAPSGALGTSNAEPAPAAVSGNVGEVFAVDALDAVLRDHRLIIVDPGAQVLRALDVTDGEELFSIELGAVATAAVIHDLGHGRLLVQVPGQQFHTIDISDARLVTQRTSPPGWRFVHRRGGACALMSDCALTPISCESGAEVGPVLRGVTVSFEPVGPDDDGAPTCAASLEVLGRAGDLSLYAARFDDTVGAEVIAFAPGGVTRWRSADVGCDSCLALGVGSAPDGSVCWTSQRRGGDHTLTAFRCADGALLFTRRFAVPEAYQPPPLVTGWVQDPPGLYVSTDDRATLIAPDGSERWSRATPDDVLVLPSGLRVPSYPLALDRYATIEDVNPSTGQETGRRPVGGSEVRVDQDGAVDIVPRGQTSDRGGAPIAPLRVFSFRRDRAGSRVSIDDQLVVELPGDARVVGEHLTPEATHLVIAEQHPGRPERVRVLVRSEPECAASCCAPQVRTPAPDGTVECCMCVSTP